MPIGASRTKSVQTDPAQRRAENIADLRRRILDPILAEGVSGPGRPFNRAVAAAVRDADHPSLEPALRDEISSFAGAVGNCGRWNVRCWPDKTGRVEVFHCDRWLLCNACANRRAWKNALLDSARVMEVYAADPSLRFIMLTLTVREFDDLVRQYDIFISNLTKLGDRRSGAWGAVRGMIWSIEYAKGLRGMWRSHVHAMVAVHDSSWQVQNALLLAWVKLTHPGLDADGLLDALAEQHSQEFWTHGNEVQSIDRMLVSLGRDAFGISAYASKPPRLSIWDRLEAFALLGGRRSRQPTGVFWGHEDDDLNARIEQVGNGVLSIRGERGGTPSASTRLDGSVKTRAQELFEQAKVRRDEHRLWKVNIDGMKDELFVGRASARPARAAEGPKRTSPVDRRLGEQTSPPEPNESTPPPSQDADVRPELLNQGGSDCERAYPLASRLKCNLPRSARKRSTGRRTTRDPHLD